MMLAVFDRFGREVEEVLVQDHNDLPFVYLDSMLLSNVPWILAS